MPDSSRERIASLLVGIFDRLQARGKEELAEEFSAAMQAADDGAYDEAVLLFVDIVNDLA